MFELLCFMVVLVFMTAGEMSVANVPRCQLSEHKLFVHSSLSKELVMCALLHHTTLLYHDYLCVCGVCVCACGVCECVCGV